MRRLFTYPYIVWLAIFVIAPLLLVFFYAFSGTDADGYTYFTFQNINKFFEGIIEGQPFFQRIYVRVATRSLRMALQTTVICFLLGYPLAHILASKGFRDKPILLFLFIMPMWMNFLVRTYGWMTILERNGIMNNLLRRMNLPTIDILFTDSAVLLGMVYNFLPFMVLPIYTALTKMDKRIIEAAQDLGASPRSVFLRVVFPLSMPGVVSGITMVFMPAAATFIIPNLLGGGQFFLLGNLVEQQFLLVGNWHFGSAVAVVMIVLMLVSTFILSRFDRQTEASEGGMRL
ncbi:MAG: ABC transporter permease [Defluviitaleaceae bacterium]|nr:ABC transporter permease [Defluviitaleaceae bacterium]